MFGEDPISGQSGRVVCIDDDADMRSLVVGLLADSGIAATACGSGSEGLFQVLADPPDLIILDINMPGLDGFEVLKQLHASPVTQAIPVLLLTANSQLNDRVKGLMAGADDYICKPFEPVELVSRVTVALRRRRRDRDIDSLTGLPGNAAIRSELTRRLGKGPGFSMAYLDLDNFKPYVDSYGFDAASGLIKAFAEAMQRVIASFPESNATLGHIGGDDFILLVDALAAKPICSRIHEVFTQMVRGHYSESDTARGHVLAADRDGKVRNFPLVGLSVAIIRIPAESNCGPAEIGRFAAQCKSTLKKAGAESKVQEFVLTC